MPFQTLSKSGLPILILMAALPPEFFEGTHPHLAEAVDSTSLHEASSRGAGQAARDSVDTGARVHLEEWIWSCLSKLPTCRDAEDRGRSLRALGVCGCPCRMRHRPEALPRNVGEAGVGCSLEPILQVHLWPQGALLGSRPPSIWPFKFPVVLAML